MTTDPGQTHFYGDDCDPPHKNPLDLPRLTMTDEEWTRFRTADERGEFDHGFDRAELDALQNAVAHWLADYLVKGWDKPDEFKAMIRAGNKIGMKL